MTQIARYAHFLKVPIKNVRAKIKMNLYFTGSILAGTVDSGADSFETDFEVESDANPEDVKKVLKVARQGCWARQMVSKPTPFKDTMTLNGQTVEI